MEVPRRSSSVTGLEYATPELQAKLGRRRALLEANGCCHEGKAVRAGESPPGPCSAPVATRYPGGRYAASMAAPPGVSSPVQASWARWPRTQQRVYDNAARQVARVFSPPHGGMNSRMTMPAQPEARALRSTVQEARPISSVGEPSARDSLALAAAHRKREEVQATERERHALRTDQQPCLDPNWALKPLSSGRARQFSDFGAPQESISSVRARQISDLGAPQEFFQHDAEALRKENQSLAGEGHQLRESIRSLREENRTTKAENVELRRENESLLEETKRMRFAHQENERLYEELAKARAALGTALEVRPVPTPAEPSAESLLRKVMTTQSSTQSDLRNAISGVSALLEEAKRELANREFRERRAAFETLHAAMEAPAEEREHRLETALAAALSAGLPSEDLAKAEEKLAELKSLTDEQKQQRDQKAWELARKKEVFLMVKKDDAAQLQALIELLDQHEVRWQDWRDYAGRSLWRCAQELRSSSTQRVLAPLLGLQEPDRLEKPKPWTGHVSNGECGRPAAPLSEVALANGHDLPEASTITAGAGVSHVAVSAWEPSKAESPKDASALPVARAAATDAGSPAVLFCGGGAVAEDATGAATDVESVAAPLAISAEETARWTAVAFRASVQDDVGKLQEMLDAVPVGVWCKWQNKAGKDLLTLAQERGSSEAYSLLAKAMGLVREQVREAFEEREAVWVFLPGEVQPRRATVLADTLPEEDVVRLEYWDGNEAEQTLDRCMVRKMG